MDKINTIFEQIQDTGIQKDITYLQAIIAEMNEQRKK